LERVAYQESTGPALRPGVIVAVLHSPIRSPGDYQCHISGPQGHRRGGIAQQGDLQILLTAEDIRQLVGTRPIGHHAHSGPLGRPVAEGDAEPCGKKDRKDEDPEDCLRLAEKLAIAHPGQLHQRMIAQRASLSHLVSGVR
jgi:hypothetical protein